MYYRSQNNQAESQNVYTLTSMFTAVLFMNKL